MNWRGFMRMAKEGLNNDAVLDFLSSDTPSLLPNVDDTVVKFGNGTYSWDVWVYGNTASDYMKWDASAGTLSANGAAIIDVPAGQFQIGSTAITATAAELNGLDHSLATNLLTRGAGVDTAESYAVGIRRAGTLITTEIVIDITGMIGSATDLDIIGESAAASCHWGQITTAKCGTLIGGYVQCLEVPTPAGVDDLDFYSSDVSTGTQDVIITDAALGTETALVTSGGAWTALQTKGMTALPTANDYLYITCGEASGGTLTAGKFKIVLYGLGS